MKNKNRKPKSQLEIYRGMRKEWSCNPVTKIIPNKKKSSRNDWKKELYN